MADIITDLLDRIDKLTLSKRIRQWKQAVNSSEWKLFADRAKWTAESWRETEGQDIQIRRARLLEKVLENIEIRILDFDTIAGRLAPNVIGCAT